MNLLHSSYLIRRVSGDLTITNESGASIYTEPGPIRLVGSLTLVR